MKIRNAIHFQYLLLAIGILVAIVNVFFPRWLSLPKDKLFHGGDVFNNAIYLYAAVVATYAALLFAINTMQTEHGMSLSNMMLSHYMAHETFVPILLHMIFAYIRPVQNRVSALR